jgi:chemotaxis protein histidine kinase CheA
MYRGAPLPVFDLTRVLENTGAAERREAVQVVVMVSSSGGRFGLMVDGLGEIVEVAEDRGRFLPSMVAAEDTFADAALTPDGVGDGELVVVLRADQLYANLANSLPRSRRRRWRPRSRSKDRGKRRPAVNKPLPLKARRSSPAPRSSSENARTAPTGDAIRPSRQSRHRCRVESDSSLTPPAKLSAPN